MKQNFSVATDKFSLMNGFLKENSSGESFKRIIQENHSRESFKRFVQEIIFTSSSQLASYTSPVLFACEKFKLHLNQGCFQNVPNLFLFEIKFDFKVDLKSR